MRNLFPALGALLGLLAVAGCASYHALPLPEHARLAASLSGIVHVMQEKGADAEPINLKQPLDVNRIGLLAILNAPELAGEHARMDLARANLIQSALLPNPSAALGYAALLGGPGTTGAFTASLTEDIASLVTYRRRVASARAQTEKVNADLLWREWQVAQKARLLAIDLYWGARSIASAQAGLRHTASAAAAVRSAVDANDADLALLSSLRDRQAQAAQSLETMRETQLANWQKLDGLLGLQPDIRFAIARPDVPMPARGPRTRISAVQHRRPDLIGLRLGYRSADERVRAAILGQFPALILGGSWGSDTSAVRSGGPTATFDLPVFNRNQGQIAQARATRLLLREQYRQQLDQTAAAIRGLYAQSQRIDAALTAARGAANAAQARVATARAAYARRDLDRLSLIRFTSAATRRNLDLFRLERARDEVRVALALELGWGLPATRVAPRHMENAS